MRRFHLFSTVFLAVMAFVLTSCGDDDPALPRHVGIWAGTEKVIQVFEDSTQAFSNTIRLELNADETGILEVTYDFGFIQRDTLEWAVLEEQSVALLVKKISGDIFSTSRFNILTDEKDRQLWERAYTLPNIEGGEFTTTVTWDLQKKE